MRHHSNQCTYTVYLYGQSKVGTGIYATNWNVRIVASRLMKKEGQVI